MKEKLLTKIREGELDRSFRELYGDAPEALSAQKARYIRAVESFFSIFPDSSENAPEGISIFSAPGRTEICGNHTDHQHGRVLAAAIDLDAIAVVSPSHTDRIRLQSEGYPKIELDLSDLTSKESERGTTAALIRGVASEFSSRGANLSGFDAYVTSDVLSGSGLSSSAAFEVLVGTIFDHLCNEKKAGAVEIAKYGQVAENAFFGKSSGLMDQMVSSVGGFVKIDFADPQKPLIEKIDCDLQSFGLDLIITDTKGSHAGLSDEYSSIPKEMEKVASFFGKTHLREVDEAEFLARIGELRCDPEISDRAILRSAHFFSDDARVEEEAAALKEKDIDRFLHLVNASGMSSANLLQNLYCTMDPNKQEIPLALMLSRNVLGHKGACRVHGGGFAGTIQAFVPKELTGKYIETLSTVFGEDACHILKIRPCGGISLVF
ncbi:MAG: galactokinase [Clostridiales bacterium]|nr:galactokinase [Clostridiales bacterium]